MRVMVIVKASKESEAGQMPSEKLLISALPFGVLACADQPWRSSDRPTRVRA
jgi:hypothetical protein